MFIRLLVTSILLIVVVVVQSAITNSSKGQTADALTLPKQASLYDDYDLNDQKTLPNNVEGSGGGAASLDEYADDEEDEQLSKVTATTIRTSVSINITTTMTTTSTVSTSTSTTTTRRKTSTTTSSNRWMKTTSNNYEPIRKRNQSSTTLSPAFNDLDASEFKDDQEEYADDLEDDAYYNEPTISNKVSPSSFSITRYPILTTRQSLAVNHTTPIWMLFTFLTRPPIAAGILAGKFFSNITKKNFFFVGLAIGIFTSIILLICIIRRYHKREKSHSSYTTGLLYPNQYGYSKSPQEFYA
jgi:hypothetical protein